MATVPFLWPDWKLGKQACHLYQSGCRREQMAYVDLDSLMRFYLQRNWFQRFGKSIRKSQEILREHGLNSGAVIILGVEEWGGREISRTREESHVCRPTWEVQWPVEGCNQPGATSQEVSQRSAFPFPAPRGQAQQKLEGIAAYQHSTSTSASLRQQAGLRRERVFLEEKNRGKQETSSMVLC